MLPHTRNSAVVKITFSSAVCVDHEFTSDFIYKTNEYSVISMLRTYLVNHYNNLTSLSL